MSMYANTRIDRNRAARIDQSELWDRRHLAVMGGRRTIRRNVALENRRTERRIMARLRWTTATVYRMPE